MSKPITTRWAAECAVRFMKALRGKIGSLTDDEEVIRDTIEGEVDVDPVMEKLIGLRQEAKAMALSRRNLSRVYSEAASVDDEREKKIKALILECLQACGQNKWTGVAGTASIREGGWSTEIVDPALIPLQYMKPVPDVEKIKTELTALRVELQAMSDNELLDAARAEGISLVGSVYVDVPRAGLINVCLARRVPGARLVLGEDTLAIRLPTRKKEMAETAE